MTSIFSTNAILLLYSKKRLDRLLKAQDDAEAAKGAGTVAAVTTTPTTPSMHTVTASGAPKAGKRGTGNGKGNKNDGKEAKTDDVTIKTPTKKRKVADMEGKAEGDEEIDD